MGQERYSSTILDLNIRWVLSGQLHASAALPRGRAPDTNEIGGWVDPRAGLDAVEWRNTSCSSRELNPRHPAHRYTDYATPAHF
jgi:hypothetical protein